jgi:hypothetical protein
MINEIDENGDSALMLSIKGVNTLVARLLSLQEKCDVNLQDKDQKTPLMRAAILRHAGLVGILLETGRVLLNDVDKSGKTALHYAVIYSALHIVILLKSVGASTDIIDNDGKLPIDYAAGDLGIIAELTEEEEEAIARISNDGCFTMDDDIIAEKKDGKRDEVKGDGSSSKGDASSFVVVARAKEDEIIMSIPANLSSFEISEPFTELPLSSAIREEFDPSTLLSIPAILPDSFNYNSLQTFLSHGRNADIFPKDAFDYLKSDLSSTITRDKLLEASFETDVFLTHVREPFCHFFSLVSFFLSFLGLGS